jgi:hypothetical protein
MERFRLIAERQRVPSTRRSSVVVPRRMRGQRRRRGGMGGSGLTPVDGMETPNLLCIIKYGKPSPDYWGAQKAVLSVSFPIVLVGLYR